jgi:hypothetical protein
MASVPEQQTRNQIIASAGQTIFTYQFLILREEDIAVWLTPVGQTPDPTADRLTLTQDYTVTGVGVETGGTVVLVNPATAGDVITEERDTIIKRETDFSVAGQFTAAAINFEEDRDVMISQELETQFLQRGLSYDETDVLGSDRKDNILPVLTPNSGNKINIWSKGAGGGLVALQIDSADDVNTLRSELASQANGGDGALLVGYFDSVGGGKTVKAKLDEINTLSSNLAANANHTSCGATLVGYNANNFATNVRDELDVLNSTRSIPLTATLSASLYTANTPNNIFPFTSYNEDSLFKIKFVTTNPGAVTLNINGIGAKALNKADGKPPEANYFLDGDSALVYFNSTTDDFRILSLTDLAIDIWATKAEVQADAAVQEGVYLTNFKDHPAIPKVWLEFQLTGPTPFVPSIINQYNVGSMSTVLAGTYKVNINNVTMANTTYCVVVSGQAFTTPEIINKTVTSFDVKIFAPVTNTIFDLVVYGQII